MNQTSIMPLCPLCKLLHEKMIREKCARKNCTSPQELVDFSLSDGESYVINLIFVSWIAKNLKTKCSAQSEPISFYLWPQFSTYVCYLLV